MISQKCIKIKPDSEINKLLYDTFTNELRKGYVEIGHDKICMPISYIDIADKIQNFEVRDTDIFVISHPKAGTTWTQELVWLISNNLDFEKAKVNILERFPFLEFQCIFDYSTHILRNSVSKFITNSVEECKIVKTVPRCIKTHLPWPLLPTTLQEGKTNAKIIYVARNPKDVCASYYHHGLLLEGFKGNFEQFCELFMAGKTHSGPYWNNVLEFWNRRFEKNILYITYEDMKTDIISIIKKTSDFLIGRQFTEIQIQKLAEHLSFENMKINSSVNYDFLDLSINQTLLNIDNKNGLMKFMRSGTIGSYKADMTSDLEKKFDEWIKEHTRDIKIRF